MTTMREQVAEEVRALLARRRLSARATARALGWSPMYLSRRMTGTAPFDVDDLAALSALLDVPVTAFFPQMIMSGGGVPMGSNKQNYWTRPSALYPYPTCADSSHFGPLTAAA